MKNIKLKTLRPNESWKNCDYRKYDFLNDELIIETSRHIYTLEYIELTTDFYLKM
ncbi:hypothetical protein [Flavobacterium sandaracinum]|uniref:hypothetical protein n=1 Tax=Flavobacterium sandaracinum TaxID=2541733 RepID=UPI003C7C54F0